MQPYQKTLAFVLLLASAGMNQAKASLIAYSSEASFLAAVGSGVGQENFSEDPPGTIFNSNQVFYNNGLELFGTTLLPTIIAAGPYGNEFEVEPSIDNVSITGFLPDGATYFGFDYSAYSSYINASFVPVGAFAWVPGDASQVSGAYQGTQDGPLVQFSLPATGFFGVISDSAFVASPGPCPPNEPTCYDKNAAEGAFTIQAADAHSFYDGFLPLVPGVGQPILYNVLLDGAPAIGPNNQLVPDFGGAPEPGSFFLIAGALAIASFASKLSRRGTSKP